MPDYETVSLCLRIPLRHRHPHDQTLRALPLPQNLLRPQIQARRQHCARSGHCMVDRRHPDLHLLLQSHQWVLG